MTRLLLGASLLVAAAPSLARAQEANKLGFVDMERAIAETEEGRKARADIKKVFDQKQKEIDEQKANLEKSFEELQKKRSLLPPEKVKDQETQLNAQLQKVQQTFMRHQEELNKKQQETLGRIVDRMQRIISKMAAGENFSMVFDRQQAGLVFAKPHLDLTNELIRRYNAGEGAEGGGAPAAPKKPAAAAPAKK